MGHDTLTEPVLVDFKVICDIQANNPRLIRKLLTAPEGYLFTYKGINYIFKCLTNR